MRKKVITVFLILLSIACKSSSNNLTTIEGNYIYFDDAAVLQTKDDIYGVYLTEKALELNQKSETTKRSPADYIVVKVKGIVSTEQDEKILWDKKLEIIEIVSITSKEEADNTLILGSN